MESNNNFISVKMKEMVPIIEDLVERGYKVNLTVTGDSMYPFLRNTIDSVLLSCKNSFNIKKGSIVLYKRRNGQYILHRICKLNKGEFYAVGDSQTQIEGPLHMEQIVAVVTAVFKDGNFKIKEISCENSLWKFLSFLWLCFLPFRPYIKKSYLTIKKIFL
jgi:hypothetical protein